MKVIDLIKKIDNNEEVPEKVKYENTIFQYNKKQKDYIHETGEGGWIGQTLLSKIMHTHYIRALLNAKVEVIGIDGRIKELIHEMRENGSNYWADRLENLIEEEK